MRKQKTETITIRIDPESKLMLIKLAKRDSRSQANMLRQLIRGEYLKMVQHDKQTAFENASR